jgi:cysteinyl-tRNA synthetase
LLTPLQKFDEIFAVLNDDDGPKMKQIADWAPTEGREKDISAELREAVQSGQMSDADIQARVDQIQELRKARNFKASDALRAETITAANVIIENTKDGIIWRRK